MICKLKDVSLAVLAVVLLYLVFHFTGIGCPIRFLTGVSCPGCGMTRALISAGTLHFHDASEYHPLWFLVPVWAVIFFYREKIPNKLYYLLSGASVALFALVYFLRMLDRHDMIVVFEPYNGFIFRVVSTIVRRWIL